MKYLSTQIGKSTSKIGIIAASQLQSIVDSRAGVPNLLEIRPRYTRSAHALQSTVPQPMWDDILGNLGPWSSSTSATEVDNRLRSRRRQGSFRPLSMNLRRSTTTSKTPTSDGRSEVGQEREAQDDPPRLLCHRAVVHAGEIVHKTHSGQPPYRAGGSPITMCAGFRRGLSAQLWRPRGNSVTFELK
jgi:hypothetical protein